MSLVGFSARNHPQQAVRDAVDDRRTPRSLFDQVHARHNFTLDAAASDDNALLPKYYTRISDGLLRSWEGERVWCNPPFSRPEPWLAKAWRAMTDERAELVVMLLPANRTEQRFWHEWVEPFRDGGGVDEQRRTPFVVSTASGRVRLPARHEEQPRADVRVRAADMAARVRLTTQFLCGRVNFAPPPGHVLGPSERKYTGPPFGCVLLTWAPELLAGVADGTRQERPGSLPEREPTT